MEFEGTRLEQDSITFTPRNELNLFIVYELDASSRDLDSNFTPKEFFSRAVKLAKKADPDKYFNSGYGIGFSLGFSLIFSFTFFIYRFYWGKSTVVSGVGNSSSAHVDKRKNISSFLVKAQHKN